jgi:hypothetical protein
MSAVDRKRGIRKEAVKQSQNYNTTNPKIDKKRNYEQELELLKHSREIYKERGGKKRDISRNMKRWNNKN